ncbi:MAG: DUF192 domain-containing protein [Nitrospira sp.]|nr:DUF192 domain-containing protein [Nitrospira sp.]
MSASIFRFRSTWVWPIFGMTSLLGLTLYMGSSQALAAGAPSKGPEEPVVSVTTPQKDTILAELADTTEKRARGLMFRPSLPQDRGMLFIFPDPQQWTFWMKNTKIPLDIIWMDQQKRIVYIERNVPGCSRSDDGCPQYQPIHDALYVLEVAAGMADALKLQRGVKLQFQLPPFSQTR